LKRAIFSLLAALVLIVGLLPTTVEAAGPKGSSRFIAIARSSGDLAGLQAEIRAAGGKVISVNRSLGTVTARASNAVRARVAASSHTAGVATDHIVRLIEPDGTNAKVNQRLAARANGNHDDAISADPAFGYPGLMWSIDRINARQAWPTTTGSDAVTVGVADTGLDFTHSELATKVSAVVDFTGTEDPPICSTYFPNPFTGTAPGIGDADLATMFGGPEKTDWNGHGSWIGGNIAGARDGVGINGIAPGVKLVALKISQWCGAAYDSELIDAFAYAADHHIDVVSISFGGYLNRSHADEDQTWKLYQKVVNYARRKGTVIVAAAGNEHVRIGRDGKVLSHGQLTLPGDPLDDLYGLYEAPGGVPNVIMVSSTGNTVNQTSASCPTPTGTAIVCKLSSDRHQPSGMGRQNQLAYYSNYGPRVDIAAPGGARKFNLPVWDGGGTPGFPYTSADGTTVWEDFSITSNWALAIPCFTFTSGPFYPGECYSTIQGTSMATPHVSAVLALIASARPSLRHHVNSLVDVLLSSAEDPGRNTTPGLSRTDTSVSDLTGKACPTGYCHLGGGAISNSDAYGAGLVDAAAAVGEGGSAGH
jgi:subtilisin family serine protease